MNHKIALVCTTINEGNFLDDYAGKLMEERIREGTIFIVIPDKKTPKALYKKCDDIKSNGINIFCPSLEDQEIFLSKLGKIKDIIPYNSDNRRNIGYLMALEKGCDIIVSIDDDNYPIGSDSFFKEHMIVGKTAEAQSISCESGWLNVCDLLDTEPDVIYPRGFPYLARRKEWKSSEASGDGAVHINQGLWVGHPDVDALTILVQNPKSLSFKGESIFLHENTWAPINTQNTAIYKDALAAYYFFRMGYPIGGFEIDRYGDIFSGYFVEKCAKHLGHAIRFGSPIVRHERNAHDPFKDVTKELACVWLLEDILPWLKELKLEGGSYTETYLALADFMEKDIDKFSGHLWTNEAKNYFKLMAGNMKIWIDSVKIIEGK